MACGKIVSVNNYNYLQYSCQKPVITSYVSYQQPASSLAISKAVPVRYVETPATQFKLVSVEKIQQQQQQPEQQVVEVAQQAVAVAAAPAQQAVAVAAAPAAVAVAGGEWITKCEPPKTFVKTVVTNVNRHHYHTQRVITNDNNYDTYVTKYVFKVNDIHHYRVENVKGETKVVNEFKETKTVEPATCKNAEAVAAVAVAAN